MSLVVGETKPLSLTLKPSDLPMHWESDDNSIATVNEEGVVTAVGPGTTNIVAIVNLQGTNWGATCSVTVTASE